MIPRPETRQGRPGTIVRAAAVAMAVPDEPAPIAVRRDEVQTPSAEAKDAEALHHLLLNLSRHVEELKARRSHAAAEIARLSVDLGVALAERLLCTEIAADRQRLDRIVQQAFARLRSPAAAVVRAHPDDVALLGKQLAETEWASLSLVADATLARGQVRLEAGDFFVAWDTATCLVELRKLLLEEIGTNGHFSP